MFCQITLDSMSVTDFCLKASACTEALPVRVVLSGFGLTGGGKPAPGGEERTERGQERRAAREPGQGWGEEVEEEGWIIDYRRGI